MSGKSNKKIRRVLKQVVAGQKQEIWRDTMANTLILPFRKRFSIAMQILRGVKK